MRGIVNNISRSFIVDKENSVIQIQSLAREFTTISYDTTKLDSAQSNVKRMKVMSFLNRYKGLKQKYVTQKTVEATNNKQIDMYLVEIYKKYSIPFACVIFVLIGAPLGMITRKGGFGVAAGMSLGFFLLYWACLIGGEKLADRELLSPFLSMWAANIVLGSAGIYLVFRDSLNIKRLFKSKTIKVKQV
jgi:lipopolysaccharide export system permease protein